MKKYLELLKETFTEWREDEAPALAAALSYYTIFSLAPLMLILIGVAGLFFGEESARNSIMEQARSMVGKDGAEAIGQMLQNTHQNNQGPVAAITGVVLLLVGASGVFGQLQTALNKIWEVAPAPDRGIWGTIKARFLSMSMVLGIGFLLMVSLVISAAVASLGQWIGGIAGSTQAFMQLGEWLVNIAIFTGLFAMIFKVLPDVEIEWKDVWVGAGATAVLFALGKVAIGLYLAKSGTGSTFGAAGSLVVLLVWVYYSSMLLFFGAEFTQVWARHHGARLQPTNGAVRVLRDKKVLTPDAEGPEVVSGTVVYARQDGPQRIVLDVDLGASRGVQSTTVVLRDGYRAADLVGRHIMTVVDANGGPMVVTAVHGDHEMVLETDEENGRRLL